MNNGDDDEEQALPGRSRRTMDRRHGSKRQKLDNLLAAEQALHAAEVGNENAGQIAPQANFADANDPNQNADCDPNPNQNVDGNATNPNRDADLNAGHMSETASESSDDAGWSSNVDEDSDVVDDNEDLEFSDDPDDPDERHNEASSESDNETDSDNEGDPGHQSLNFDHVSLQRPIQMVTVPTVRELLLLDLSLLVRHNLTYECLMDNFKNKNVAFGRKHFPTSKSELWRILGRNHSGMKFHIYCSNCGSYIGKKKNQQDVTCPCGFQTTTKKAKCFVVLSLREQLRQFLSQPGMGELLLKYKERREKHLANSIEDTLDGQNYKKLVEDGIVGPFDFTMFLNTDGCKIRKGGKLDIYPIFVRVNEFPPLLRQKFMFLAGVYVDRKEPKMSSLLMPIVKQLNKVSSRGVKWFRRGEEIESKFVVSGFCVDGKARYQLLNMCSHGSFFACTYCTIKGVAVGENSTMRWPIKDHPQIPAYEDRTDEGMKAAMFQGTPTNAVEGHKGPSPLMLLDHLDLRKGNCVDDLHVIYECAAAHATNLLLTVAPRVREGMSTVELIARIDSRLQEISTPTNVSRKPGVCSIKNRLQWKGSEWRNWLLYYAVPCLQGLIVQEYLTPLEHLSRGSYLLSLDIITDAFIVEAEAGLSRFLHSNEELYGLEFTKLNLHTLLHAGRCVRENGPLWSYSTFNFESWNHRVIKSVSSAAGALLQIAVRHLIHSSLAHAAFSQEDLSPHVRLQLQGTLSKKTHVHAREVSEHVYVLGIPKYRALSKSEQEVLVKEKLIKEGYNLPIQEFKKILIKGSKYGTSQPGSRSDNSLIYTYSDTFCSVSSVVLFQDEQSTFRAGLFVFEHEVYISPFEHAKHITALKPDHQKLFHFILPAAVRAPVVKMPILGSNYVVPLPNVYEID